MAMLELMMAQLKKMGFDPDVAKTQIATAVGDIRAMKESQDRTEAMVRKLYEYSPTNVRDLPSEAGRIARGEQTVGRPAL
jgi:hypothetical protein